MLKRNKNILIAMLALIFIAGCKSETTVSTLSTPVEGSGEFTVITDKGGLGEFEYSQDFGTTSTDVYFVFTNSTSSSTSSAPSVSSIKGEVASSKASKAKITRTQNFHPRGWDRATAFNNNPPRLAKKSANQRKIVVPKRQMSTVGDTYAFKNSSASDLVASTLRAQVTDGTTTVNAWVADNAWDTGCGKKACLTQTMVDAILAKFLASGSDNDIYDWVTNIFGVPWGANEYTDVIPDSSAATIDILFFDIDGDDSQTGGVLGFYWAKDNILTTASSSFTHSNERLMFYMDSVLTATESGTSWEIDDLWPAEMVSTLAHEFQHMIHFYQKTLLLANGSGSETWLNEMAAMAAEDLLASKMQVKGPRGIDYSDPTAGSASHALSGERIGYYNNINYIPLNEWTSSLDNYGMSYAFAAYITRNFGGAELMKNIVQNKYTDIQAVTDAIKTMGYKQADGSAETAQSVIMKWGIAGILSNTTDAPVGYRYNIGKNFDSSLNGVDYVLGSINIFNYGDPQFYSPSGLSSKGTAKAYSNTFVEVETGATGSFSKKISMPSGVGLAVITK